MKKRIKSNLCFLLALVVFISAFSTLSLSASSEQFPQDLEREIVRDFAIIEPVLSEEPAIYSRTIVGDEVVAYVSTENVDDGYVAVVPLSTTLTLSPSGNWVNIPASGGSYRDITVTTNAATHNVFVPAWMNLEFLTNNRFRIRAESNHAMTTRTGTVTVSAGDQSRSFTVTQLAAVSAIRNGVGSSYIQLQGRNLYLQGLNVRTRNLPSQQWGIAFQATIGGNRYYHLTQGTTILAATATGPNVGIIAPASLPQAQRNRGLWRFERVGTNHYRIINRWANDNNWTTIALTGSTTNGAAVTLQNRGVAEQLWYIRRVSNFLHYHSHNWPYAFRTATRSFSVLLCPTSVQGTGWEQAVRDGLTSWNVASGDRNAGVNITLRTTGERTPHVVEMRNRNATLPNAFGTLNFVRMGTGNIIEHSRIHLYAQRINEYALTFRNVPALAIARSVASHESGHMLGLGDSPPNYVNSVMHGSRTRSRVTSHSSFDARNVRLMFGVS